MQSKNLLVITGIVAALSLAIEGSLVHALATPPVFRIEQDVCVMGDANGNLISASNAKVLQVQMTSSSSTGTISYKCTAAVPNDTGRAVIFNFDNTDGAKCGSVNFHFLTTDWQETISTNGNAQLICHVTYQ
jgi:hypothetical protein